MINLNADVAEGYGHYRIGDDDALIPLVGSVNVACGAHGGDFRTMRHAVELAVRHGVSIGAQPGFPDLWGFGRRRLDFAAADIESFVAAQIGALQGVAALAGASVTHVKPHGALYNMAAERDDYAGAIAAAVAAVDPQLILVGQAGSAMIAAGRARGLTVAREGFVDRAYTAAGLLVARGEPGAVITDAQAAAGRAVGMVVDGHVEAIDGTSLALAVDTLCIHGDEPTAPAVATAVAAALRAAGVATAPLPELFAGTNGPGAPHTDR